MATEGSATVVVRRNTLKVPPSPRRNLDFLAELQKKHKFSVAVMKQNEVAATAIKSLDCLNDQIVQYIVSGQCGPESDDAKPNNEAVQSSMILIRRLLLDAQARFRRMVEDNKQLASHIDGSIQAANQEVSMLRAELTSTNKRLSQISQHDEREMTEVGIQVDPDSVEQNDVNNEAPDALEVTIMSLTSANKQLIDDYKRLLEEHDVIKLSYQDTKSEHGTMKVENNHLKQELSSLRQEYEEIREIRMDTGAGGGKPAYGELKLELIQSRQELKRAKEVLQGMKSDRKRLKGEKLDLLSQMKQLYATLEDKETELRDFIRNYEQRVKESDDMIKQLAKEKEETDHEKWDIITKARDAAERAVFFRAQLDNREQQVKSLETELAEAKRLLSNAGKTFPSPTIPPTGSIKSGNSNDNNNSLMCNTDNFSISSTGEDTCHLNLNSSVASTPMLGWRGDSNDGNVSLSRLCSQSSEATDISSPDSTSIKASKKKKMSFSGLSRMFSRSRLRRSIAVSKDEGLQHEVPDTITDFHTKLCVLNQDNYQEKLSTVEHMVGLHMKDWRAHHVLAWLEITLGMPMYAISCLHNIKSGRVLLGLSDSELSSALGVTNHIHRRKLRLSIEQHRNPNEIMYPKANEMDPTWVTHRFLTDLGLPQYSSIFEEQLCDGHILNTLTRRDLEKYFTVHRKFHQSSILHAVEALRRIDFNKEKLYKRRNQSDDSDTDLIVWTNERLIKWTRSIDLGEYSDNLLESGVNGGLIVLEPTFCSDALASILGIPPSKSYIRRHLSAELDTILKPARMHQKGLKILRAALDTHDSKETTDESTPLKEEKEKGKKLIRMRRGSTHEEGGKTKLSFRGSLGRAFGKKIRDDLKLSFDSDQSKKKISAPIPIQHSSLSSLENNSELIKKGFCFPNTRKDGQGPVSETNLHNNASHSDIDLKQDLTDSDENLPPKETAEKTRSQSSSSLCRTTLPSSLPPPTQTQTMSLASPSAASTIVTATGASTTSQQHENSSETNNPEPSSPGAMPSQPGALTNHGNHDQKDDNVFKECSSSQETLTDLSSIKLSEKNNNRRGEQYQSPTESLSQSSSTESTSVMKPGKQPLKLTKSLEQDAVTGKPPLKSANLAKDQARKSVNGDQEVKKGRKSESDCDAVPRNIKPKRDILAHTTSV